ncbi:hypothetical protein D3C87_1639700 [compost metagenome]
MRIGDRQHGLNVAGSGLEIRDIAAGMLRGLLDQVVTLVYVLSLVRCRRPLLALQRAEVRLQRAVEGANGREQALLHVGEEKTPTTA